MAELYRISRSGAVLVVRRDGDYVTYEVEVGGVPRFIDGRVLVPSEEDNRTAARRVLTALDTPEVDGVRALLDQRSR